MLTRKCFSESKVKLYNVSKIKKTLQFAEVYRFIDSYCLSIVFYTFCLTHMLLAIIDDNTYLAPICLQSDVSIVPILSINDQL